jgi:hypothetical protein
MSLRENAFSAASAAKAALIWLRLRHGYNLALTEKTLVTQ